MYMNLITTTELRTKVPLILNLLSRGESLDLIHRSKLVGEIKPKKYAGKVLTTAGIERIIALAKKMHLPKLTEKQMERNYRAHIMKKYGKGLS